MLTAAGGMAAAGYFLSQPHVAAAAPRATTELGKVKIIDVHTASIKLSYYPAHLVKITTDAGLYGIGEAYNRAGVVSHIHEIKRQIIGQDPLQVDYLYQKMCDAGVGGGARAGTLSVAIAGIETALWDLVGKILNVPIYVLLGGKFRDRVLIYHDTGSPNTRDPKPWVDEMVRSREYGFRAIKVEPSRTSTRGRRSGRSSSSRRVTSFSPTRRSVAVCSR